MRIRLLLFVLLLAQFFSSCEEDFDVNAPYKDITIVYGLLDHKDTTHYIRIQKAFLGNGSALVYSTIPDSLYYPPGLQAYILGYDQSGNKVPADSFHLDRVVNEFNKDSGIFAAFNNVIYKGVKVLDQTHTYQLIIIKPNGDTVSATTPLTGSITMAGAPSILDFEPGSGDTAEVFHWASDPTAFVYQLSFYIHYEEWKFGSPGTIQNKTVIHNFNMFKPAPQYECLINQVCFWTLKSHFYGIIKNGIPKDPLETDSADLRMRRFTHMDVKVSVGAQELYNYVKINAPSLSYVQKVHSYTNINNGLGIFSARSSGGYYGLQVNSQTLDSIVNGHYTLGYNFVY